MKKITKIILGIFFLSILWIFYKNPYIFLWYKPYFYWCNSFLPISDIENWQQTNSLLLNDIWQYAIWVDFDIHTCKNTVWIIIYYDTLKNRDKILKIIWNHFLLEWIPFKMYNI